MGTADFAVAPLETLIQRGYPVAAVVTAPDKPAGRGLKVHSSPVCIFARENNLKLLQPQNLKDPSFLDSLSEINPNLQIVVAFRMLPEQVWKLPKLGTFNLHASLLPDYRGAAPINRVIMNGETKTGVTTFFINENIDTGNILLQEETNIHPDETAGELHDRLMAMGSDLVVKTTDLIQKGNYSLTIQASVIDKNSLLNNAPKIYKEDCIIPWNKGLVRIFNHIRGLSPYPAAITEIISPEGTHYYIKVFQCTIKKSNHAFPCGKILTDGKTAVSVAVAGGFVELEEIQLQSKKKMRITEFLRGFPMNEQWTVKTLQP